VGQILFRGRPLAPSTGAGEVKNSLPDMDFEKSARVLGPSGQQALFSSPAH